MDSLFICLSPQFLLKAVAECVVEKPRNVAVKTRKEMCMSCYEEKILSSIPCIECLFGVIKQCLRRKFLCILPVQKFSDGACTARTHVRRAGNWKAIGY